MSSSLLLRSGAQSAMRRTSFGCWAMIRPATARCWLSLSGSSSGTRTRTDFASRRRPRTSSASSGVVLATGSRRCFIRSSSSLSKNDPEEGGELYYDVRRQPHHNHPHAPAEPAKEEEQEEERRRLVQVHPDRVVVAFPPPADSEHHPDGKRPRARCCDRAAAASSTFHAAWLWSNDPRGVHPSSGQRLRSPHTFFVAGAQIRAARFVTVPDGDGSDAEQPPPATAAATSSSSSHSSDISTVPPRPPRGSLHPVGGPYRVEMADPRAAKDHLHPATRRTRTVLCVTWKTTSTTSGDGDGDDNDNDNDGENQQHESWYDLDWLGRNRYDGAALRQRRAATAVRKEDSLHAGYALQTMNYHCLTAASDENDDCHLHMVDDARFDLLHAVLEEGAALVQGAPDFVVQHHPDDDDDDDDATPEKRVDTVSVVGRLLSGGRLSHGNLYGDVFHVRSAPRARNIAYTAQPLAPHQDLAYYESPPGLQLLHCARRSPDGGGASVLVDALAAAGELRRLAPDLFDVLARCDATFVKQRQGGDMVYRRPHIGVSAAGTHVVSVRWSPPFEGPLAVPAARVQDYFVAYSAFQRMLDNSLPAASEQRLLPMLPLSLEEALCDYARHFTWEYNLSPGEILIFNNQRLLHGRRGFSLTQSSDHCDDNDHQQIEQQQQHHHQRHLIGCYTNIDDTLNEYRLLRRQRYPHLEELPYIRNAGNGSSSTT